MSTDPLELMQLSIDGATTPEQENELRLLLSSSPEAKATFDSLRNVALRLDRVPLIDPPSPITWRPSPSARPVHVYPMRRKVVLAHAYAAAAVIVVVFALRRFEPAAPTAAATMVAVENEDWPVVARASSPDAKMVIRMSGDELEIAVSSSLLSRLTWDQSKLSGPAVANFSKSPKSITLQRRPGATGSAVVRLQLPDRPGLQATIDLP